MRKLCCVILGSLALQSPSVFSQEVWVGRPTVGDYVRRDVHQLVTAFVELQRAGVEKEVLTQDIVKARKAFFATAASPERRAEVAKEFALLLNKKDIYYFAMYTSQGTDSRGINTVKALDVISRGAVDGGIFPEAFREYLAWVNGIRSSLGFSGDSALGALSGKAMTALQDKAAVAKAFQDNEPLHAKYVEARDRAEIERFTKQRQLNQDLRAANQRIAGAKAADGSFKLDSESTVPLQMAFHIRGDLLAKMPQQWNVSIRSLAVAKTPVLECHYGPVSASDSGQPRFETHKFWHATVPPTLGGFFPVNNGALGFAKFDNLDKNIALAACPPTNTQALAIASNSPTAMAPAAVPPEGTAATPSPVSSPRPVEVAAPLPNGPVPSPPQPSRRGDATPQQCSRLQSDIGRFRGDPRSARNLAILEKRYADWCAGR